MLLWAGIGLVIGYAAVRFLRYPRPDPPFEHLSRLDAAFVAAAADAMFPRGGAIEPSGTDAGIPRYMDRYLAALPPGKRILIHLLFFLVEHATLFFPTRPLGWRRFSSLPVEERARALEGWRTSRFVPRRLVFLSLRALLTMGYFADPTVLRALDLAPRDIRAPAVEADLLYPPVGRGPDAIRVRPEDVGATDFPRPLDAHTPLHPAYVEDGS